MDMKKISVAVLAATVCGSVAAADQIKDAYHPSVNGSPITLMQDNYITQQLGGRWLDVDVWVGDFVKIDDNIFGNDKKDDDVINSVAAGFKAEGSAGDAWDVRVEAQIQHNDYKNFGEFDGEEGYVRANGKLNLSPALTLKGGVSYNRTLDTNPPTSTDSGLYNLDKTGVSAGVTIRPTEFLGVDVNYGFYSQRRDDLTEAQDYDENSLSARVFHNYSDNVTLYTQVNYAKADPKNGNLHNETDSYDGNLGFSWRYMDAANFFAEVGVRYMDFGSFNGHFTDTTEDVTRVTARAGGAFDVNADWKVKGEISWLPYVGSKTSSSTGSNYTDNFNLSAAAVYSPGAGRFTAMFGPYFTAAQPSNDEKYTESGVSLGVTYSVTDMLNLSAGYHFSSTNYDVSGDFSRNVVTLGVAGTF